MVRRAMAGSGVSAGGIKMALKVAQSELDATARVDDAVVAGLKHGMAVMRSLDVVEPWPEARWNRLRHFAADAGLVMVAAAALYGIARAAGLPAFGWLP